MLKYIRARHTHLPASLGKLCMLGVGFPDLLRALRPLGQHLHGRVEEVVDVCHLLRDGLAQRVEEGVKQALDVVVNDSLHGHRVHCDAVYLDGAGEGNNRHINLLTEMTSDGPINTGKHVTSKISCVLDGAGGCINKHHYHIHQDVGGGNNRHLK